jgi:hypothetical protein
VFEIFGFVLQTELENLSTRLEECSLQCPAEKPHNTQICTASVAMVTDTDKQGVENDNLHFQYYPESCCVVSFRRLQLSAIVSYNSHLHLLVMLQICFILRLAVLGFHQDSV